MTKRKLQISMVFIIVILCYFSYQFGGWLQQSYFNKWNIDHSSILPSELLEDKYEKEVENGYYPSGGNKELIEEQFVVGSSSPIEHDSILSGEIEQDAWFISEYIKKNAIIDDDRDDVLLSRTYDMDENETINHSMNNQRVSDEAIGVNSFSEDKSISILNETTKKALSIDNPNLNIDASNAVLMDANTGKILYHKNAIDRVYPASTVKIMTAIVALMHSEPTDEVTVGEEINLMASDSSRAYLNEGEILTMEMLLEGLLLPSGNDAAYVIANYVGKNLENNKNISIEESVQNFVDEMNEVSKTYGLLNTHFMNPDGYDHDEQYTSAYDMALIAKHALEYPEIIRISKMERARNVFISGEDVTWKSGNRLIQPGSGVFYKYAIGLKSGTSSLAGRCMVSAGKKGEDTVISVVLNSSAQGRWADSLALLKYGVE